MTFSGRVYDGPREGEYREFELPYFVIPLTKPLSVYSYNRHDPPASISVEKGYYRWSQPLRAWVYCWDGNLDRYAYEAYRYKVG